MSKRTWITVGAAGTLGLGLVAGGAFATANATTVNTPNAAAGPAVVGSDRSGDRTLTVRVTGDHASVASAPSAAVSVASAPSND